MKRTDKGKIIYPNNLPSKERRFARAMINHVRDFCFKYGIYHPIISCSAGIDSTCLGQILKQVQIITAGEVSPTYVHIAHQLRPEENKKELLFLNKTFEPLHVLDGKVAYGAGLQERARDIRKKLLIKFCNDAQKTGIFTAHTETDDVETILMRAFKKKFSYTEENQRVVYGMKEEVDWEGTKFYKPLLCWSRQDVVRYMLAFKLSWCEDSSNATDKYTRNYLRNVIIPQMLER